MQNKEVKFSCPLDCVNACAMIATVNNGRIINIRGDRDHPITQGMFCEKGRQHLTRLYHTARLKNPKKKVNGRWIDLSYAAALDEIAEKLIRIRNEYGSQAVLHYFDSGYTGISKVKNAAAFCIRLYLSAI